MKRKGVSVTEKPRALRSWMAATTVSSDGRAAVGGAAFDLADEVRLLAGEAGDAPGEGLGDLVGGVDAGADLRSRPARRSVPNQPTMRLTEATLGSVAWSWSRATAQSLPPWRVCTFSETLAAAPSLRVTGSGA